MHSESEEISGERQRKRQRDGGERGYQYQNKNNHVSKHKLEFFVIQPSIRDINGSVKKY